MDTLTLPKPDDWHCHFRDGELLARTVPDSARHFARAIAMPNLTPALTSVPAVLAYRERLLNAIPKHLQFTPLMTLYLNEQLSPADIHQGREAGIIAAKLYPKNATTNAEQGTDDLKALYPVFSAMQDCGMRLLIHGEIADPTIDVFDREQHFIERHLGEILQTFPELQIVLEHVSTAFAVNYVQKASSSLAATITPHHLLLNRNDLLVGGLKPHYYCLPILKREADRLALIKAATSGNPKFFLGTDSAPHAVSRKESACGCAGIYNAPVALAILAAIFEREGALSRLADFVSRFGALFYDLPVNSETLTLQKKPWQVPLQLGFGEQQVVPLCAGQTLAWRVQEDDL